MATLNFDCILLMLVDQGSIPQDTLQSQDRLNLGDVHFCPIRQTFHMQCISLDHLWRLITEGAFMLPVLEGPPKLSGTTTILLVFQVDGQHERITDVYVGLMVCRVKSHLYTTDQILDFVTDIEVDLKAACDALKTRGDPSKRHAFCLFVSNYGGTMSIPTDPPYCLFYPTSYVRDVKPDHFDTYNKPAGIHLCHCICHTTLQYMNDRSQSAQRICWELPDPTLWGSVQGVIVPGDPQAMKPLGATDQFCHQGAFLHETSGRLKVNGPNPQRVLWQLIPVH